MNDESAQIVKGGAAAISTLAGGVYLLYAQTIIGMIGVVVGAIYTAVLTKKLLIEIDIKKHIKESQDRLEKAQIEDIKFRQEHDMPCRGYTDKEEHNES